MIFKYDMIQTGWGKAEISCDACRVTFEPSYISDPYGDMIRAVCAIIPGLCPERQQQPSAQVRWNMAPLEIVIDLRYDEPDIGIGITQFDDTEPQTKKTIILNSRIQADALVGELVDSGRNMLRKYGFIGYRHNSVNFEFPMSAFLKLLNYGEGDTRLHARQDDCSPLFSSCIHTELNRLTDLN